MKSDFGLCFVINNYFVTDKTSHTSLAIHVTFEHPHMTYINTNSVVVCIDVLLLSFGSHYSEDEMLLAGF